MNKEALVKLATVRLAINYVLRNRMIKQAGNISDNRVTNTADFPKARKDFLRKNKSFGPRIPVSIGIPWTNIRWDIDNINPLYKDRTDLRMRLMLQNRQDQRNSLLPHLRGAIGPYGMPEDPNRQYYDENRDMLDIYRTRYENDDLDPNEYDAYQYMEHDFRSMYPTDSYGK